jgi:uncharacterized protein DUF3237
MTDLPDAITGEHLLDVHFTLAPPEQVGAGPYGMRSIYVITGGSFEGARLRGTARPGGADWLLSPASHNEIDVRGTLETDDGALIYITYRGVLKVDSALAARVIGGEDISPSAYYFRTTPRFETGHEKYDWLNSLVCVGYGRFGAGVVDYRVFAIT